MKKVAIILFLAGASQAQGMNIQALNNSLIDAAADANMRGVMTALGNGAQINAQDADGDTALANAVIIGDYNIAYYLLNNGANPNIQNNNGETALMLAVDAGNTDLVELILTYFPDLNLQDQNNQTAWDIAQIVQNLDIIDLFLKYRAIFGA